MKRFFALAALAALTFSGCIKEDNTYKEWSKVQAGTYIHDWALTQNDIAMKPASMAIRLGMLLSEAAKQNPGVELKSVDLVNLAVNKISVMSKLFGGNIKIEFLETGYKMTFVENIQHPDGYYYKGSLLIATNGAAQLSETTAGAKWNVSLVDFYTLAYNSGSSSSSTITYENCNTSVYNNGEGGYTAEVNSARTYINENKQRSNWNATFQVKPANENLAYSDCAGKNFTVKGRGEGPAFVSFNYAGDATSLVYESEGTYRSQSAYLNVTETASLGGYGDYELSTYPAREVIYRWTYDEAKNTVSRIIYYNSFTYPKQ